MAGDVCAIFVSICGFFFVLMKSAQVEDTNGCTFHHSIGFAGALHHVPAASRAFFRMFHLFVCCV